MTIHHGGGGSALSFAPGNIAGVRVEMKVCELCGGMYVRRVNPEARIGRDCARCIAAAKRRQAKEARELLAARTADGRYAARGDATKMMPAQ
jgi:hypothetical protein